MLTGSEVFGRGYQQGRAEEADEQMRQTRQTRQTRRTTRRRSCHVRRVRRMMCVNKSMIEAFIGIHAHETTSETCRLTRVRGMQRRALRLCGGMITLRVRGGRHGAWSGTLREPSTWGEGLGDGSGTERENKLALLG